MTNGKVNWVTLYNQSQVNYLIWYFNLTEQQSELNNLIWYLTLFRPPLEHFHPSLQRHNSPANSVRELFKSSTDSASLLVSIKNKYFIWVGGSLGGGVTKQGCIWNFDQFWLARDANPMSQNFGSNFFET